MNGPRRGLRDNGIGMHGERYEGQILRAWAENLVVAMYFRLYMHAWLMLEEYSIVLTFSKEWYISFCHGSQVDKEKE